MSATVRRAFVLAALVAAGTGAARLAACSVGRTPSPREVAPRATQFDATLPVRGMRLPVLPDGAGRAVVDRACPSCHSGDMLRQQRLTEKQWTATVTKRIGWGAALADEEKAQVIAYLAQHFGPDNDRVRPVVTWLTGR